MKQPSGRLALKQISWFFIVSCTQAADTDQTVQSHDGPQGADHGAGAFGVGGK